MNYSDKDIQILSTQEILAFINEHSYDLHKNLDPFLNRIGDARIVLLGDGSHGTHEYYIWCARIIRRLIEEKGFTIIGVVGDWPDCYQVNRYVRHYENIAKTALDVIINFQKWPSWIWGNWEMIAFIEWLKNFNHGKDYHQQVGFYGLDAFCLWESLDFIKTYLRKNYTNAVVAGNNILQWFESFNRKIDNNTSCFRFDPESFENEVVELLKILRRETPSYSTDPESPFNIKQNALTTINAERYFRAMIGGGINLFNKRDEHMTDTLERLLDFHGPQSKAIIWEQNIHIADKNHTDIKEESLLNLRQLTREKWGVTNTVSVGFGSYKGTVMASDEWGGAMKKMVVPEASKNSWEYILHQSSATDKLIITKDIETHPALRIPLNHRTIGVTYKPEMDFHSNYLPGLVSKRYDAYIYLDKIHALHPVITKNNSQQKPESYPWSI